MWGTKMSCRRNCLNPIWKRCFETPIFTDLLLPHQLKMFSGSLNKSIVCSKRFYKVPLGPPWKHLIEYKHYQRHPKFWHHKRSTGADCGTDILVFMTSWRRKKKTNISILRIKNSKTTIIDGRHLMSITFIVQQ